MNNRQLHRLKKQWLAEGCIAALQDIENGNITLLDEGWGKAILGGAKALLKGSSKAASKYGKTAMQKVIKPGAKMAWDATKGILRDVTIQLLAETLPKLIKQKGAAAARKISNTARNKAAVSKNVFEELFYEALAEIPVEDAVNLTVDQISGNIVKSINSKLSEADGYVPPSKNDIEDMLNGYKAEVA